MDGAKSIKKFHSIRLVECMLKLLSKVLARRLTKVLREVTGERQNVFVEGRQILDAMIVANEVVDELMSSKKEGLSCKLDMEKAYENVNWDFVDYMLGRSGFGDRWRKWIKQCITTIFFAVMVNGGASSFVTAS